MISQRLAKAFTKFEWVDERYDPICSIPLTKALCEVVEAVEFVSARQSKDENYIVRIPGERLDEISQALRELERALKECGV